MKNIITLLVFATILYSCNGEPKEVSNGRKMYMKYFKKTFKDPSSIKIYSEKYERLKDGEVKWTLDVGGKNSYGGMVRDTHVITTGGVYIIDEDGNMILKSKFE